MGDDLLRLGWWYDYRREAWISGRYAIAVEFIKRYPRAEVQRIAMRDAGRMLPPEAFPGPPPPIVQAIEAARTMGMIEP